MGKAKTSGILCAYELIRKNYMKTVIYGLFGVFFLHEISIKKLALLGRMAYLGCGNGAIRHDGIG